MVGDATTIQQDQGLVGIGAAGGAQAAQVGLVARAARRLQPMLDEAARRHLMESGIVHGAGHLDQPGCRRRRRHRGGSGRRRLHLEGHGLRPTPPQQQRPADGDPQQRGQ